MSKIAVVYQSKSGSTAKYAHWLAEAAGADLMETKRTIIDDLLQYDTIVCGGGLYITGINGVKLITDNMNKLQGKKLAVFAVGASPVRQDAMDTVISSNFTPEMLKSIKFFMLRGGFDFKKCTFIDKILMILLKMKIKSRKNKGPDEIGMLHTYTHPADWTNQKYLEPILEYIKG